MLRSKRLDDEGVSNLKRPQKRVTIPDPELRGHYIRITPSGTKSFWAVARDPSGKQHWQLIGQADSIKIEDARDKARKIIRAIRAAIGGEVAKDSSFEGVALDWFQRHVVKNGLRSERKMRALLKKVIIPAFAGMEFVDVRRKHITTLLDRIEDKHGVRQSDYALSILSGICGWYAKRDEDYASPIIRGMKRQKKNDRDRVLTDAEIRTIWNDADGLLGNFTKLALLTGQRREKLHTMRYDDVCNGVWHIHSEAREKGNGEELRLPTVALEILENQKAICPGPRVFDCPITRLRNLKLRFDLRHKMQAWWIHDLRRTSRTLMAAAGVPDVVAELVLGHVQRGVQAIYNRHAYFEEKGDALEKLATRLSDIIYERKAA
jgi:Arm DNA-binding domain